MVLFFFHVTTHVRSTESGVLLRLQSLSVMSSPGSLVPLPYSKTLLDSASLQIRAVNAAPTAVLPEETVVHKHSHTDMALATYRNETIQALFTPHQDPGSSQGIIVYLCPGCGEKRQFKSLFALFCIEWSHWNVRNVFSKGRPRRL